MIGTEGETWTEKKKKNENGAWESLIGLQGGWAGGSQAVVRWVRWGGGGLVWPMLPAEETRPERREKSEDSDNFTTASQREEEKNKSASTG